MFVWVSPEGGLATQNVQIDDSFWQISRIFLTVTPSSTQKSKTTEIYTISSQWA